MDELKEVLDAVERDTVSVDTLCDVLRVERRRHVLVTLQTHETSLALADLAAEIAKREAADGAPPPETVTHVHASLYHTHLPKLKEANLITYNHDRHTVQLTS